MTAVSRQVLLQQIKELQKEKLELEDWKESYINQYQSLLKCVQMKNREISNLENDLEKARKLNESLLIKNKSITNTNANLSGSLNDQLFNIQSLNAKIANLNWSNNTLIESNDKYEDTLSDLRKELKENETEIKQLRISLNQKQQSKDKENDIKIQRQINKQLRNQNKTLQQKLDMKLRGVISISSHNKLINQKKERIKELWSIINSLREEQAQCNCCIIIEPNKKKQRQNDI